MLPRPTVSRRLTPRSAAERDAQECAVGCTAHMDAVPSADGDYWYDLRKGKRRLYGGLLVWIDRCRALGTPFRFVRFGVRVVWDYACDVFGEDPASFFAPFPPPALGARATRMTETGTVLRAA